MSRIYIKSQNFLEKMRSMEKQEFFILLLSAMLILVIVNAVIAWITTFYTNGSVISVLSFRGYDPSWIPIDVNQNLIGPALGTHYFGDFSQYIGYAKSHLDPYGTVVKLPAAYGPATIDLFKIINFVVGWPKAIFVYLCATAFFIATGLVELLGKKIVSLPFTIIFFASAPLVAAFDRGNLQLLVFIFLINAVIALTTGKDLKAVIFISLASSIKLYCFLLVIVYLLVKKPKYLIYSAAITSLLYIIPFLTLGGSLFENIKMFVSTNLQFGIPGNNSLGGCLATTSFVAIIGKILWLVLGQTSFEKLSTHFPSALLYLPQIFITTIIAFGIYFGRSSRRITLFFVFAAIQLIPNGTYPYTEVNLIIQFSILFCMYSENEFSYIGQTAQQISMIFLTIALAPWTFFIIGSQGAGTPAPWLIGPVFELFTVILVIISMVRKKTYLAKPSL